MDFEQNMDKMNTPYQNRSCETMALASFILGLITILTSGCIYLAIVCGSLGIILALLSRGGEMKLSPRGTAGLALSSIGLALTFLIYIIAFVYVISYYGGIDEFMDAYMKLYNGGSIEELYQSMGMIQ